jgi:hypothetical protein
MTGECISGKLQVGVKCMSVEWEGYYKHTYARCALAEHWLNRHKSFNRPMNF